MGANITAASPTSLLGFLADDFRQSPTSYFTVLGALFVAVMLHKLSTPALDSLEPPLLKPSIPIIGHIIGMMKHQGTYLKILYDGSSRQIATLPILGGKLYVIFDPAIIQSIYRKKTFSFEPFATEFAQRELGISDETFKIIRTTNIVPDFFQVIHPAMTGDHLHRMNANALRYVSKELDSIGDARNPFKTPNLWLWLRDLMTMATAEALYGPENPLMKEPSLLRDLWTFEQGLSMILVNVLPSITARKAFYARARLQASLGKYYDARKDDDPDAAEIVRARANVLREYNVPGVEVGHFELALLHVGTANTIPTLFWFIVHIFSRPDLVQRLREEVLPAAQHDGHNNVTIDITTLDRRCPLLSSCYREAVRLSNQNVGNRRVLEDTMVSDGKGKSYLLKKGENLQIPARVCHELGQVWGENVLDFNPERFLESKETSESDKLKRAAYLPFGGGRHLCPGRNFAFAENLGLVTCLLLGFDAVFPDGPGIPPGLTCEFSQAAFKPANNGEGFGIQVQRKKGWEETKWLFVS
ncbi:hypothetical protein F66182_4470 [Fusarium sp. NRRL 66182]|nr:hypothetical protein F66182_4470 [Fusarium sp. NRRL 66182]